MSSGLLRSEQGAAQEDARRTGSRRTSPNRVSSKSVVVGSVRAAVDFESQSVALLGAQLWSAVL